MALVAVVSLAVVVFAAGLGMAVAAVALVGLFSPAPRRT